MASTKKGGMGLLPKLIIGIFVPILLAFLIIGSMLFFSVTVGNVQFISIKDLGLDSLKELGAATLEGVDSLSE